jgi:hypothetical protein
LLSLKGKVGRSGRKLVPKDPRKSAFFDEESSPAKNEEIGVFYLGTGDDPDLLLGYTRIGQ